MLIAISIVVAVLTLAFVITHILPKRISPSAKDNKVPISVNYHFTRRCNYTCGFCFHTAKTSYILSLDEAKRSLSLLHATGMRKLNFAGGEPFLYPDFMGELARYCKEDLGLEALSIVTNGSKVTKDWIDEFGRHINVMAVSCDSFDEATNIKIGRGKGKHVGNLPKLREWCDEAGIKFKINTVVNRFNFEEDMIANIKAIDPFRWKIFQVLVVPGENDSDASIRNAERFVISNEEFESFRKRHESVEAMVPEGNDVMRGCYLILDEYMRYLDQERGEMGKSILDVGVHEGLRIVRWDEEGFTRRGGVYDWSRKGDEHQLAPSLEW